MSKKFIPYGHQEIASEDLDAVAEVLRSDWLTQGPMVPRFEQAVAEYCGAAHAVAVNSGTSALHIACLALGLGPGDRLWTSPNTFLASANCARYCGAEVDFVDIDPRSWNMSVGALAGKLETAAAQQRLPKIVVPVHFGGQSCDMQRIYELGQRYGFRIVEDAAHALGGRYRGRRIGDCRWSDITIFSFHPVKIITTAEGGAALTNDPWLAERMDRLRSHGTTRDPAVVQEEPDGPWTYHMIELGWNYRMTDIQAALGCSQMPRLDDHLRRRIELADHYDALLDGNQIGRPWRDPACQSAWHLYVIQWNSAASGMSRGEAYARLRTAGIGVNVHYIPVHTQPYYRALGFRPGDFPNAESFYARALTLPLFPTMTTDDQDRVVAAIRAMLQ